MLSIEREQVKQEVKNRLFQNIDNQQLIKFTVHKKFSHQQLHWENEGEFEYQQAMYDVVRSESLGDSISYYCITDVKESRINQDFKKLLAYTLGQQPKRQHQESMLLDFFKSLFLTENPIWQFYSPKNERTYCYIESPTKFRAHTPAIPPPWL